jgi:hypothetical protein
VATKASVVASALGMFDIIVVAPKDKTEATPKITATTVKVIIVFMVLIVSHLI